LQYIIYYLTMISKFGKKQKDFNSQVKTFNSSIYTVLKRNFQYYRFKYSFPGKNSILIIEPNSHSHGEVLPYFVKYFLEKKYNVDVVISPWLDHMKALHMLNHKRLRKYTFNPLKNKNFILKKIHKYKYIFFNSQIIYYNGEEVSIFKYYPYLNNYREKIYCIQHHIEHLDKNDIKNHTIILTELPNTNTDLLVANPHYFGNVKITQKNESCTNFIIVGSTEQKRKDFNLLFDAIYKLINIGVTNFHITHIGRGNIELPQNIEKYFSLKGYLDYKTMYEEIEKSDFILPLLNPDIKEHQRYIKNGTSGSFQLIYGFLKPSIIHKYFATTYHFDDNNSIIYETNENLYTAMNNAIKIPQKEYSALQENLKIYADKIEKESLNNLDRNFK